MIKVDEGLFKVTNKELLKMSPSDFGDETMVYVVDSKSGKIKYVIELKKGGYKTFALKSRVMDGDTFKYLTVPGGSKGFKPYYIDDFLHR
jgi:hypothetical protein